MNNRTLVLDSILLYKKNAPRKRREHIFSTGHLSFILFAEIICKYRSQKYLCNNILGYDTTNDHHPSSFFGFTAAEFGFFAAGAGAALVDPPFAPWPPLATETSKPTRL